MMVRVFANRLGLGINDVKVCHRRFIVSEYKKTPQQLFEWDKLNSDVNNMSNVLLGD